MSDEERSLVPAVTRAAAILDLLSHERSALGVSAIARRLGLPKSSVANICSTMVDAGLLRAQDGGVQLGHRLAQLGGAYLGGIDQVRLFQESCALLRSGGDDTVQLAMLSDGIDVIYLAKRDGVYPVRLASTPGRALPATCTATGKAMLATLTDEEVTDRLPAAGSLPRLTASSITTRAELLAELHQIRSRGYALDREEVIEGVVCVGVAIPRRSPAEQLLAVSITLLKPRATAPHLRELAEELREVTDAIAAGLGVAQRRSAAAG
jgi:IclR family transcriptional regulator, blcABC operon repressor